MILVLFSDFLTHSFQSGRVCYLPGRFVVIVEKIPETAPQDWLLGPKQTAGLFGAYRYNPSSWKGWNQHGPYAFATGKTEEVALSEAAGSFRRKAREPLEAKTPAALRALLRQEGIL